MLPGWSTFSLKPLGGVAVEDRAAEGHAVDAVAVAAHRHVPAGHDELELASPGLPKMAMFCSSPQPLAFVLQLLVDLA